MTFLKKLSSFISSFSLNSIKVSLSNETHNKHCDLIHKVLRKSQ